jgi:hypothetical protein
MLVPCLEHMSLIVVFMGEESSRSLSGILRVPIHERCIRKIIRICFS